MSHWAVRLWIGLRPGANCRVRYGGLDGGSLARQLVRSHEDIMSVYTKKASGPFDVTRGKRERGTERGKRSRDGRLCFFGNEQEKKNKVGPFCTSS